MMIRKTLPFPIKPNIWDDLYFDISKSAKKSVKHKYMNTYRDVFMEDIALRAFPYLHGNKSNYISLTSDNKIIKNAFLNEQDRYSGNFRTFFESVLYDMFLYDKIALEITFNEGKLHISKFPARSLHYSWIKGKYYQKMPKISQKNRAELFAYEEYINKFKRVYFNRDNFFIIHTPKVLLKVLPKFAERTNMIDPDNFVQNMFACRNLGIEHNMIREQKLFKHRIFRDVGLGRLEEQKDITEYYYLIRHLKMALFAARVREDMMSQFNKLLKGICTQLGCQEVQFVAKDLVSSQDYLDIMDKLKVDKISFEEAINAVFNKK